MLGFSQSGRLFSRAILAIMFSFSICAVSYIAAAEAASGKKLFCRVNHHHHGSGKVQRTKALAKRSAGRAWEPFTQFEYGPSAKFSMAKNKRFTCQRRSGGWQCDVRARPCYYRTARRR